MRVQNGVLENESISSIAARPDASQQVSEQIITVYLVSFEHSVSLQVLHSHSNRPRLKSLGENSKFGGGGEFSPQNVPE